MTHVYDNIEVSSKACEIRNILDKMIIKFGNLPVTIVGASHEFSVSAIGCAEEGPLINISDMQTQYPPNRIVLEAKDNIPLIGLHKLVDCES